MIWDKREFGLTDEDRRFSIEKKFGAKNVFKVMKRLNEIENSSDRLLGAVVFLLRPSNYDDLDSLVIDANRSPESVLRAAAVKEERG